MRASPTIASFVSGPYELCGVKEIDAALHRFANEGDHLRSILKFAGLAIAHAAQRES